MKQIVKIVITFNVLVVQLGNYASLQTMHHNINHYQKVFVLGDSLSDTGAFVQYQGDQFSRLVYDLECSGGLEPPKPWVKSQRCIKTIKFWKPKEFKRPFYRNSFSNGPVAVQVAVDKLRIKNFKSGSYSKNEFDNFGYNYATGSAKVLTSEELWKTEFKAQLEAFSLRSDRYCLEQQVKILKQHHKKIEERDLLVIVIGSNDIMEIIESWLFYESEEWKQILIKRMEKVINQIFYYVKDLLNYGFKRILVSNVPNLSRTPRYKSNPQNREVVLDIVLKYNEAFSNKFYQLREASEFRKKIKKFNLFNVMNDILYNFEMQRKITGKPAVDIDWATSFFFKDSFTPYYIDNANEDNLDNYAFFDDIHPTNNFHNEVGHKMHEVINEYWPFQ